MGQDETVLVEPENVVRDRADESGYLVLSVLAADVRRVPIAREKRDLARETTNLVGALYRKLRRKGAACGSERRHYFPERVYRRLHETVEREVGQAEAERQDQRIGDGLRKHGFVREEIPSCEGEREHRRQPQEEWA